MASDLGDLGRIRAAGLPRLILTRGAIDGLERCRTFLDRNDAAASVRAANTIARHLQRLELSPDMGRPVPSPSPMRELVIPFGNSGYVALYRHVQAEDAVYVLAFRHQREAGY